MGIASDHKITESVSSKRQISVCWMCKNGKLDCPDTLVFWWIWANDTKKISMTFSQQAFITPTVSDKYKQIEIKC